MLFLGRHTGPKAKNASWLAFTVHPLKAGHPKCFQEGSWRGIRPWISFDAVRALSRLQGARISESRSRPALPRPASTRRGWSRRDVAVPMGRPLALTEQSQFLYGHANDFRTDPPAPIPPCVGATGRDRANSTRLPLAQTLRPCSRGGDCYLLFIVDPILRRYGEARKPVNFHQPVDFAG